MVYLKLMEDRMEHSVNNYAITINNIFLKYQTEFIYTEHYFLSALVQDMYLWLCTCILDLIQFDSVLFVTFFENLYRNSEIF